MLQIVGSIAIAWYVLLNADTGFEVPLEDVHLFGGDNVHEYSFRGTGKHQTHLVQE